jgi:hypothetical protein
MNEELLEKLAALEHLQWCCWSRTIANEENISKDRLERWRALWVPYEELPEEYKEEDRDYARIILETLSEEDKVN